MSNLIRFEAALQADVLTLHPTLHDMHWEAKAGESFPVLEDGLMAGPSKTGSGFNRRVFSCLSSRSLFPAGFTPNALVYFEVRFLTRVTNLLLFETPYPNDCMRLL